MGTDLLHFAAPVPFPAPPAAPAPPPASVPAPPAAPAPPRSPGRLIECFPQLLEILCLEFPLLVNNKVQARPARRVRVVLQRRRAVLCIHNVRRLAVEGGHLNRGRGQGKQCQGREKHRGEELGNTEQESARRWVVMGPIGRAVRAGAPTQQTRARLAASPTKKRTSRLRDSQRRGNVSGDTS